ncbi:hypothetical protein FKR81_18595 [Lentzea tibetensis]|uniref:P/Homo B domain-containing protein n=1 Tax=Lentzea tibetensis TaxID=2591470 RepID=A0A563ESH9_9PSEU|nr:hypothetical protein FKR81_18595 [Lentzea tibetensis]
MQRYGGSRALVSPGAKSFTVHPAAGERAGGRWTLRMGDNSPGDTGVRDTWSITV